MSGATYVSEKWRVFDTHVLVQKSKQRSSITITSKKPQSLACSREFKYTLSWLLGIEANVLGSLHVMPDSSTNQKLDYTRPHGETNYWGKICNQGILESAFSYKGGNMNAAVKLEETLGRQIPKCRGRCCWIQRSLGELSLNSCWQKYALEKGVATALLGLPTMIFCAMKVSVLQFNSLSLVRFWKYVLSHWLQNLYKSN